MREEILEVKDTSLDEWLELLRHPPKGKLFVRNMFPSDRHRKEWLQTSHTKTEDDVRLLLRNFLVSAGSNPMDHLQAEMLVSRIRNGAKVNDLAEHDRHLLAYVLSKGERPVWEGLSWTLDLLAQHPRMALNVLEAFFHAYYSQLTDNYLSGLFDAQAVIRNRYIESSHTQDSAGRVLLGLEWRELEWLCGILYDHMGWNVRVTPRTNDDGVDVFASKDKMGEKSLTVVQAKKRGESNPLGKDDLRELLGAIDFHRAASGALVTTGRFESGAIEMAGQDSRLEAIDRDQLIHMMNEHCGGDWYTRIDRLLANIKHTACDTNTRRPEDS